MDNPMGILTSLLSKASGSFTLASMYLAQGLTEQAQKQYAAGIDALYEFENCMDALRKEKEKKEEDEVLSRY